MEREIVLPRYKVLLSFRSSAVLAFAALTLQAADWEQFRTGPFEVLSNAGERKGRETLNFLEQLRHTLGYQIGETDLQPAFPVRVLLLKERDSINPTPRLGRDAYMMSVHEMTPSATAGVVKLLLDGWSGYLPPDIERGLIQLYATISIDGTRIRLGAPPERKDRDWTRAHLFAVDPNYSGKLRVLLGNLSRGVERDVAYRNAFAQTPEEIERAVDRYMEAGKYDTVPAHSKPLNPRRELVGREVENAVGELALADLALAHGLPDAEARYQKLGQTPEAREGSGLLALKSGNKEQARAALKDAASAYAQFEYAKLLTDPAEKRAALAKAAAANKRWAEPHKQLADMETHPAQRLAALRKATELEPRSAELWMRLAELQEDSKQFVEAGKSWTQAERTTDDPTERDRIRQRRLASEKKRVDAQIAAREEARRKTEQELQEVRNRALMSIREAEARANAGKPVIDPTTLEEYKEGANTKKVSGALTRVECMGAQARLHVTSGRQITRLFVANPGQVALVGGGQIAFTCGAQPAGRKVTVEYQPRTDRAGAAGDVVTVEFTK